MKTDPIKIGAIAGIVFWTIVIIGGILLLTGCATTFPLPEPCKICDASTAPRHDAPSRLFLPNVPTPCGQPHPGWSYALRERMRREERPPLSTPMDVADSEFMSRFPIPVRSTSNGNGNDNTLTQRGRELLNSVGSGNLAARVQVRWNARMSISGTAVPAKALITLNPRLREFGDEAVDSTLRHELAHLLAQDRAGRRRISPHGPEWLRARQLLGVSDESSRDQWGLLPLFPLRK